MCIAYASPRGTARGEGLGTASGRPTGDGDGEGSASCVGASGAVFGLFTVSVFSRLSLRELDWRRIVEVLM